jgi:phosphatidylglycerol:prolipoprotein diacylglycerol transferase
MFVHDLNPILVKFSFIEIRWYSLAYIFGILIGWWLAKKIIRIKINNGEISFNIKVFDDLISWLIISIIVGGRIGYVFFYNLSYYLNNPLDILKIWEGGMSFHGALIGVILGTYFFSKKINIKTFFFLDAISTVAPIGIFFGRVANFINAELYGKPTNLIWSVIFPSVDLIPRHPSQLYEALLEGIVLFLILINIALRKNSKVGTCSGLFMIFYGLFRVLTEQFREPDIQVGYLFGLFSMGTLLSMCMVLIGLFIFFKVKNNEFSK